jgi:peroxiredoxin
MIETGNKMPAGIFAVMTEDGPSEVSTDQLFDRNKVVLVSVPGAFTPTCSARHLPGFLSHADELKAKGVDTIAFMSVNDVHVMHAWAKDQGVGDNIVMLADGNGDYAKALGLDFDGSPFGMGLRGQRFALIVDDGTVTHVAVEAPGQFEVSKAESILESL